MDVLRAMPPVLVRRARPEDEQCSRSFLHQRSPASRRDRFHGTLSEPSPKLLVALLGDGGISHGVWVACVWGTTGLGTRVDRFAWSGRFLELKSAILNMQDPCYELKAVNALLRCIMTASSLVTVEIASGR